MRATVRISRVWVPVVAALILTGACCAQAVRPLVGLAGGKYKAGYVGACESLGADAVQMPGSELESLEALSAYDAVVAVTNGDMGQEGYGLTEAAQAAVAEYIAGGGRVLCTYGCAPPAQVSGGSFSRFGRGSHWHVSNSEHPITRGMQLGQTVVYGAERGRVTGLDERATVLLEETSGDPALLIAEHGDGCVLYACGDLGYAAGWDGTARELRDRVLSYLIYGRAQERCGPPPAAPRAIERQWPRVLTPRKLSDGESRARAPLIATDLSAPPSDLVATFGYRVESVDGTWQVTPPPGESLLAPWASIPLGSVEIEPEATYTLLAAARIAGPAPNAYAPTECRIRFYNIDGIEIPHRTISSGMFAVGESGHAQAEGVAPVGAARATAEIVTMLPAGTLTIESVTLTRAQNAEEQLAGDAPLAMPSEHPRAVMSAEALTQFRQKVAISDKGQFGTSPADMFAAIVRRADAYLAESEITIGKDQSLPWPPTEMPTRGGGLSWNPLASAVAERLKSLSIAYAGTADERYGDRAKELLLAICEWPAWSDPVNDYIALEIGNISIGAAFAHDLCHDLLSEQERALAAQAIRRNALLPLYAGLSSGMGNTNGYALWATAMGLCAISVHGEAEGASECIGRAEDCMLGYFDMRATDHRTEGQGYDAWAYGLLVFLADSLKRNCGADHLDHPFFPTMVDFGTAFMSNDRTKQAWFADAGGGVSNVSWHFPFTLLGSWTGDPDAGWYLKETQMLGQPGWDHYKLIACEMDMPVAEHAPDPPGAVFPRVGWASLRSGWERDGVFVALQCSSAAQGHSHEDQNNFLIYDGGRMMAMDCGYASALGGAQREFARGAVGHNCILVDGKMQVAKRGSIPFYRSTDSIDYAMGDATLAYSSSMIERAHRHLLLLKPRLLLVVDDLWAAGGEREFQWLLHPHSWSSEGGIAEVTRDGQAVEVGALATPGDIDIVKGEHAMTLRFLQPAGMTAGLVVYPGAENYNSYVQATSPKAERTVLVTLIQIGDVDVADPAATVADGTVSFSATVNGQACAVTLQLAGEDGRSPQLRYEVGGETVFEAGDLRVPEDAEG